MEGGLRQWFWLWLLRPWLWPGVQPGERERGKVLVGSGVCVEFEPRSY